MKKCIICLLAVCMLASSILTGCSAKPAEPATREPIAAVEVESGNPAEMWATVSDDAGTHVDSDEVNAAYLAHYFDVVLSEPVTAGAYAEALSAIQPVLLGETIDPDDANAVMNGLDAVRYAVIGAGQRELASIYDAQRIDNALATVSDLPEVPEADRAFLACAIDLKMVGADQARVLAKNLPISAADANRLLMATAEYNGTGRNMLGYTDDPATCARILNLWNSILAANDPASLCKDETLVSIGVKSLMDGITTGFNIVDSSRDGRFLPELTINYFHDDIRHIKQLFGLLESEGIVCKVQVNPEFSVYQYLPEWNDDEPNPTYRVVQAADDFYLVYTIGYFVELEFQNAGDRLSFDQLIKTYAKKSSGEEDKNLLYSSWWQPTYESYAKVDDAYHEIHDQTITHNNYVMRVGTLESIYEQLAPLAVDGCTAAHTTYWINDAYWRYMNGEGE
ncbi:MAG: hypothetical protein ACI4RE_00500 [Christensenellales bacterium]|nr:putative uncharacterized protein [Clostridium sp. CAG:1024]